MKLYSPSVPSMVSARSLYRGSGEGLVVSYRMSLNMSSMLLYTGLPPHKSFGVKIPHSLKLVGCQIIRTEGKLRG